MITKNNIKNCLHDFDTALSDYCGGVIQKGELHALAGWVNQPCLDDLNAILAKYLIPGNRIRFTLAWIDKSPIAEYIPSGAATPISGELGDVAIIRLHVHSKGTAISQLGRMLLFQAKVSKAGPPFVPSNVTTGVTQKEFSFMTSWPPFTLRAWGASARNNTCFDVMNGVALADRTTKLREMNWFGVAPSDPANRGAWAQQTYSSSPWWTAPPVSQRACDIPLSKLLLKIALAWVAIDPADQDGVAGREFRFPAASLTPATNNAYSTWDDLANEIINIAQSNNPAKEQIFATSRIIQFLTNYSPPPLLPAVASLGNASGDKPFPVIFVTHLE